jgi:putative protease
MFRAKQGFLVTLLFFFLLFFCQKKYTSYQVVIFSIVSTHQRFFTESDCDFYLGNGEGGFVMAEEKIGEVVKFFAKPCVAAIKVTNGEVKVGDTLKITGHTTDITNTLESMEIENQKVEKAVAGDYIGIKVSDRVRPGDEVFKVIP